MWKKNETIDKVSAADFWFVMFILFRCEKKWNDKILYRNFVVSDW